MRLERDHGYLGGQESGRQPGAWAFGPGRWIAGLLAGGALVGLVLLSLFFQAVPDLVWGWRHGWTAVYAGSNFRVPFGWRQLHAGAQDVALRNAMHGGLGFRTPAQIDLSVSERPFDADAMVVRTERRQTRELTPGDTLEPTPTDPFLQRHYSCSEIVRFREGEMSVRCFDREGRWAASARGGVGLIEDLSQILQRLPSAAAEAR